MATVLVTTVTDDNSQTDNRHNYQMKTVELPLEVWLTLEVLRAQIAVERAFEKLADSARQEWT